jgi:hypothetical protein
MGYYIPAPATTRDLALGWTIQLLKPVIRACGQGLSSFSGLHPFPMMGSRAPWSSNATKFAVLSPLSVWGSKSREQYLETQSKPL